MVTTPPTLIMVAGISMRAQEFEPLQKNLESKGLLSHTWDNLCVGEGPRHPNPTIEEQAKHMWAQVDAHVKERPIALFGLSMGGMIAAQMAASRPKDVAHLVVAASSLNAPDLPAVPDDLYKDQINLRTPEDIFESIAIGFSHTMLKENHQVVDKYYRYRLQQHNKQNYEEYVAQLNAVRSFQGMSVYPKLQEMGIPMTLISAAEDQLFPPLHARRIAPFVKKHVILPKTGHMIHLESEETLARTIAASIKAPIG